MSRQQFRNIPSGRRTADILVTSSIGYGALSLVVSAAVFCLCIAVVDSQIEAVPALADGSAVLDQSLFSHVMFSSIEDSDVEAAGTDNLMLTCSASVHLSPATSHPQRERRLLQTRQSVSRSSLRRTPYDAEFIVLAGDSAVMREVMDPVAEVTTMALSVPREFDTWWMFADIPEGVLVPICPPENTSDSALVVRTTELSEQDDLRDSLNGHSTDQGRDSLRIPLAAVQHPEQHPLPFLEFVQLGTTVRNHYLIVPFSDTLRNHDSHFRQLENLIQP